MKCACKKILLVDDDADFRRATRKILESKGFGVTEATGGNEGYDMAQTENPDLIIIDVIMESFSEGFKLIQKLATNDKTKDVPRILLTTLGIQQDLDMIYPQEIGTKSILQKPIKKEELLASVQAAIGA